MVIMIGTKKATEVADLVDYENLGRKEEVEIVLFEVEIGRDEE